MCGIVGLATPQANMIINRSLGLMEHRGNDDRAMYYDNIVSLGMNRLAIIDLRKNLYPMKYQNRYIMVYNGEIYNSLELRQQLNTMGINLSSNCDGEVVLPLYAMHGPEAFRLLEGMFAICIYDKLQKTITLARDKAGEKPLYYQEKQDFGFASELKVLLQTSSVPPYLNHLALQSYLIHGSVYGNETLVAGINKVRPGSYITYNLKSKTIKQGAYWQPANFSSTTRSLRATVQTLNHLLRHSVESRMAADVPVGAFLSGGVDSSLITAMAVNKNPDLHTFSVHFPESICHDESKFSAAVSRYLHTQHHMVPFTGNDAKELLHSLASLTDEPIVDPALLPTAYLAKTAKQYVDVVLTGEGADEIFGGYYRYQKESTAQHFRHWFNRIPGVLSLRNKYAPHRLTRIFDSEPYSPQHIWTLKELGTLLDKSANLLDLKQASSYTLSELQLHDFQGYLAEQLLMKVDKATMYHTLEARAPYLDTKIISMGLSLPDHYKIRFYQGKYVLKLVAQQHLPPWIIWRPKHGFSLPLNVWLRDQLSTDVWESVDSMQNYQSIWNVDYYRKLVTEHMNGQSDYHNKLWSIVVLMKWLTHYSIKVDA